MTSSSVPIDALVRIRQVCRWSVAGIWFYQGLVPKLLGPHADELAMAGAVGVPAHLQVAASYAGGVAEIALALCILLLPSAVWPQLVSAITMILLLACVAIWVPHYMVGAFNPVVMNVASLALSLVAILAQGNSAAQRG